MQESFWWWQCHISVIRYSLPHSPTSWDLIWLSLLSILMQESFWWWQCHISVIRYSLPHSPTSWDLVIRYSLPHSPTSWDLVIRYSLPHSPTSWDLVIRYSLPHSPTFWDLVIRYSLPHSPHLLGSRSPPGTFRRQPGVKTTEPSRDEDFHSSGAVWESRWPSWAVRPNEPSGFRGRKAILNRASALVTACP